MRGRPWLPSFTQPPHPSAPSPTISTVNSVSKLPPFLHPYGHYLHPLLTGPRSTLLPVCILALLPSFLHSAAGLFFKQWKSNDASPKIKPPSKISHSFYKKGLTPCPAHRFRGPSSSRLSTAAQTSLLSLPQTCPFFCHLQISAWNVLSQIGRLLQESVQMSSAQRGLPWPTPPLPPQLYFSTKVALIHL